MTGSLVTQTTACKWKKDGGICPFCHAAQETAWHRFWECQHWSSVRMSWLNRWTLQTLMSVLPVGTLTTGVMPTDVQLEKLKYEAEVDLPEPELQEVAETVYTDGSAIDPSDPLLRRAAWAVTWPTPTGWKTVSGPCPGAYAGRSAS